jgi:YggT family protein
MILCALRVFMSWAPGVSAGKAGEILRSVVDPYFTLFSRIRFLRSGRFDFSPIAALAVLSVANNLLTTLAYTGKITVGFVLSLLVGALWSAVGFVLSFLAACALVRVIVHAARWNSLHPIWMILDSILNPVLHQVNRFIYRSKAVDYLQGLVTGFIVLILARAAGGAAVGLAVRLLISLPF